MIKSTIPLSPEAGSVTGILMLPENSEAILLFAHGAGAPMDHPFMTKVADGLHHHKIGTLRFNFPYMEKGKKAPGKPKEAIDSITTISKRLLETYDIPIFIGGKSYGGRMASHAAAEGYINKVRGIIFFGFPLHAPGKNSTERAEHLGLIKHPMLFLQGTKDKLAEINLIRQVTSDLPNATLVEYADADHSFKVPKKAEKSQDEVFEHMIKEAAQWMKKV